jgi:hypothetical protein
VLPIVLMLTLTLTALAVAEVTTLLVLTAEEGRVPENEWLWYISEAVIGFPPLSGEMREKKSGKQNEQNDHGTKSKQENQNRRWGEKNENEKKRTLCHKRALSRRFDFSTQGQLLLSLFRSLFL